MLETSQHDEELIARIVPGGGEMGRRMRELDWTNVAVGQPSAWSPSFRSALSICLGSRFPIALYWGDALTLIYNDAWSPILGTKHPLALGAPARAVWPEIWDAIGPLFASVLDTGESSYQEDGLLLMNRHGYTEECYFNFTFTPVRGDDGRIEGVFNAVIETTFRVISERRASVLRDLAEQATSDRSIDDVAKRVMNRLGAARHDVTFSLIYLADGSGGLRRLGSSGLEDADAIGPAYITARSAAELRWRFDDVRRSGKVEVIAELDLLARPLAGGAWPEPTHSALVAPIRSTSAPQTWGFLIIGASPRLAVDREYEEFAERAAATVARVVASTLALDAERRRADELAEVDRAKTAFFSNISHEFRTPLTLMLAPLEDAIESSSGSLNSSDLQAVHRNTLRLLKLVNSLLDFARVQAGRASAAYESVDLAALTTDLSSAFRSAIERAGIRFEVDCPPLQEPVFVDREMWEKIILNLLSNALKFTFEGTIRISQRTVGDHVTVEVSDTGVGIAAHEMSRLFERFHRIEGTRARTHEGSGIGLALVHDLVLLQGGTIDATSELGKGTTFQLTLPRGHAHLPAGDIVTEIRSPDNESTARPFVVEALRWGDSIPNTPNSSGDDSRRHVLIADDNVDMREYLSRLLGQHWSVVTVADGGQALVAIQHRRPDLVVTDLMMPIVDGATLLHAMRANESTRDIPVIGLSARAGEEARVEGLRAGFDDYVVKPFSARELVVRVEAQLSRAQLRAVTDLHNRRLASVFANTPVGIAILRGSEHVFEFVNASYRALVPDRCVVGKPIRQAFPDLVEQGVFDMLDAVYATGEPQIVRSRGLMLARADGVVEERFFDWVYEPLRDATGAVDSIVVVAFEVTELARARRLAESANRAKDEFMAMLGHELRNPLAPILTAVELMRIRGVTSLEKERSVIERQATHLVRLVDDLLDVSRITTGKVELKKQRLEISEVIARALEMSSSMLEQRKHHLSLHVPARGLLVDGDAGRLAQVFSNLLTNAAKYTEPGGVVTVTAMREDARVVVRVRDSGIGISADMLPRVFELFAQERQALDRAQGGLGLGLAIVRNLVSMHGGNVSVASDGHGRGSEFIVSLPAVTAVGMEHQTPGPSSTADATLSTGLTRVMVVDDNADAAELLADTLAKTGYVTRVAHDGPSALVVAEEFKPDIALLDIGLPAMDGYELARALRQGELAAVRLIAVTGYGQETDLRAANSSGFDAHLVKPVDMVRLRTLLRQLGRG